MTDTWTPAEVDLLITLVKNNECIYNSRLAGYSNRNVISKVWEDIAKELGNKSSRECNRKWNVLRAGYRRARRQPSQKHIKWIYFDKLSYLERFRKKNQTSKNSNTVSSPSSTELVTDITTNTSIDNNDVQTNYKAENNIDIHEVWLEEQSLNEYDSNEKVEEVVVNTKRKKSSMELFLESVLVDIEAIPEENHIDFKLDILKVLQKYKSPKK